jgi:hypothetical protein
MSALVRRGPSARLHRQWPRATRNTASSEAAASGRGRHAPDHARAISAARSIHAHDSATVCALRTSTTTRRRPSKSRLWDAVGMGRDCVAAWITEARNAERSGVRTSDRRITVTFASAIPRG